LCYQLIIHVCSATNLRKINFCKFFLSFLHFQCEASGRPLSASGRVLLRRPDRTPVRPNACGSNGRTIRLLVQKCATCPHVYEAACVRTRLISHPDGDPTGSIKAPGRRIFTLPHQKSLFWLLVSDFSLVFGIFSPFLVFLCITLSSQVFF
jgi:hypothetical protein